MLEVLQIRNLALIDELQIRFAPGLNVITGETGAGKSILISALALALGDRYISSSSKEGKTEVEVVFNSNTLRRILKREVRQDGRTRAWIDNKSVTIAELRNEASRWVDLTAQREGITLLDPASHIRHLDRIANLADEVAQVETLFARWQVLTQQLKTIETKLERLQETEELARFQLAEIEAFCPVEGEDAELDREIRILEGAETLIVELNELIEILDQGDQAAADQIATTAQKLLHAASIDESLNPLVGRLQEVVSILRDTSHELSKRLENVQLDPQRLEELRDRRGHLSRLIRKYGGSMEALLQTFDSLKRRESGGEELELERRKIQKAMNQHLMEWEAALIRLSERRHRQAPFLCEKMRESLQAVGVKKPQFEITWSEVIGEKVKFPKSGEKTVATRGWDQVEFFISFNPGQPLMPIQNVVSGGELSRVMLLLKALHPPERTPPVLIFDEIDTGISGRTARQVGLRLKELAKQRQVLLVTHLPQIASLADHHSVVEKHIRKSTTQVTVREVPIGKPEQIEEIARLVGGEYITEAARATARELIEKL